MAPTKVPSAADETSVFTFNDVSFTVDTKEGKKTIIQNISGRVPSGTVLAILGPSGAGKTTLINVLTMDPAAGDGNPRGRMILNCTSPRVFN